MTGKVYQSDMVKVKDETTGVEVTRLTDNQGNSMHPYFTQPLISEDGSLLLITSDRTGSWQLYTLELKTGKIVQLTDDPEVGAGSPCLDIKGMIAYYWSNGRLKSVNLETLKTEVLYAVPQGFKPGALSITADGDKVDFSYSEILQLSTVTGKLYSGMSETLFRHPSSMVMRVNTRTGAANALWGEREWISHVITSPTDPDIVVFCHEGHWHLVQRTWVVKESTHEVWPIVEQKRYLERAGHEIFTKKGRIVTQYGIRPTPTSAWKCSDVFIYPDGSCMEKFDYPGLKPMHVQVDSAEAFGIGDSAYLEGGFADAKKFMTVIKYEDGKANMRLLCRHDTSWTTQASHPHPIFTPDDRSVIFGSDREGGNNVYTAPVNRW